jgi:hypothetical protein
VTKAWIPPRGVVGKNGDRRPAFFPERSAARILAYLIFYGAGFWRSGSAVSGGAR